jgi:hypothetical protein
MTERDAESRRGVAQRREGAKSGTAERNLAATLTRAGIDTFDFGFAIFDDGLRLVDFNHAFRALRDYPATP